MQFENYDDFERHQLANVDYYTACAFLGRGKYDTRKAATVDEAKAIGTTMRPGRTMIYAVSTERTSVYLLTV